MTDAAPDAEALARSAQHESGHAAARWALGIPILRIELDGPQGSVTWPVPGAQLRAGQSWLIQACGAIADYQRRGLRMRDLAIVHLLMGSQDNMFDLDDASGSVAERVSRLPAVAPGADLERITALMDAQRWPPALRIQRWRDSERFAASARPAIDALAAELLACGQITGDEAHRICAAAMPGKPAPDVPGWAR
ncbi:MAG TPA: hypothetical protein VGI64_17845 [Streptosporangiaceae bacterium]